MNERHERDVWAMLCPTNASPFSIVVFFLLLSFERPNIFWEALCARHGVSRASSNSCVQAVCPESQ